MTDGVMTASRSVDIVTYRTRLALSGIPPGVRTASSAVILAVGEEEPMEKKRFHLETL
jgi:hypothetical protein